MKNRLLLLVSIIAIGCNSNITELSPEPHITILKFKEPSYKNYPIVSKYGSNNDAELVLMRGNRCSAEYIKNTSGKEWTYDFQPTENRNPYIELADGWFLVDWMWYMYPFDGKILLTDVSWDIYNGEYHFESNQSHIQGLENICYRKDIPIKDIIAYIYPEKNYPTYRINMYDTVSGEYVLEMNEYQLVEFTNCENHPAFPYLSDKTTCMCEIVSEMDELWSIIRKQLITIINNGDINNLPSVSVSDLSLD